jgi:succinylglutamate desuccinylase
LTAHTEVLKGGLPGVERVLGRVSGAAPGPTLISLGGLHGNEPAGILALLAVLRSLEGREAHLSGDFVALSGNRGALEQNRRFLSKDLNRAWVPGRLRGFQDAGDTSATPTHSPDPEDREQAELLSAVEEAVHRSRGEVFFLDLHTTSGPGEPFSTTVDSLANRKFALGLPVPFVLGLGELVEGTLLGYLTDLGIPGVVFEGGKNDDPDSVAATEAAIWVGLAGAGLVEEGLFPEVSKGQKHLLETTRGLPRVLEMRYRHPINAGNGFRMLPGLRSFQPVAEGQTVAKDREGEVCSPEAGRLLLPLYQAEGEDGFFLVREFHPFWLTVSRLLRRSGIGRFLHWLPGVREDPSASRHLIVDRRVARWYTLEVLHLLGFRKKAEEDRRLLVMRQR